ncbi:PREDICTED: glutamate-rich protein 2 [Propithecus coquereli]|uniref:glutamate-rich protein 2 n=1 Tax=Propithecus coquereli TaxID=379532 RepID=UPI00063FA406|nr:PREDICTED: glutamate-rich protein 2 [Propithecus coquereli]
MDIDVPICLPSALLKVAGARAHVRPTLPASTGRRSPGFSCTRPRLHGNVASRAPGSKPSASRELGWPSVFALRTVGFTRPQAGRLLVFDPKEKVMIEPNEAMSDKCLFGHRPRLASKLYASSTQVSLNVAKTFSEKKEVSSKNIENKVSSKNIENKDILNLQSDLWSSSFLKESTGEVGKDAVIAKQEKNNEYCLKNIDDKLSESIDDDDDEDDTNDEDNDEDSNPKKDTCAPLELMTEFLRAEMGRDYHLAKKLCQMILIYEPENPEAKEFLALIEEMLLMEKGQNLKKDDEDSEEDSSGESEGESREDLNDESSEECEDGS